MQREPHVGFGCARCFGTDPDVAWQAARAQLVVALVEESHFHVRLTACACGQRFVDVFTERIDWHGGNDPMDSAVAPLTVAECAELLAAGGDVSERRIEELVAGRRWLHRGFPSDSAGAANRWRDGGFFVGPHD